MGRVAEHIRENAKKEIKKIVLAEGDDIRAVEAAKIAVTDGFAQIILLGTPQIIKKHAKSIEFDLSMVQIIDPRHSRNINIYADKLYELRKKKGMTEEQAVELVKTPLYFGTMMVKMGNADGMVCGCITSSADVMRAALQVIKTERGISLVSTAFLMEMEQGEGDVYAFADCVVNVNPSASQAADIAISSAKTFESFVGEEPRVAMLSYTTYGIDTDVVLRKMEEAAYLAKMRMPELKIDGEMQLDAAIDESVARMKLGRSEVGGKANVLIFPDLNSGNISYKLVQRLCGAKVIGPIMQGLAKPINDLSRGCVAEEIADVIAVTAIQAQNKVN